MAAERDRAEHLRPVGFDTAEDDGPELPVFDLDALETALPRERVRLNGRYYTLATADDLSALQRENLRRVFIRMREIELLPTFDGGFLPEDVADSYDRMARYMCRVALYDADDALVDTLTPLQQNGLRRYFLERINLAPLMADLLRIAMRQLSARATATASVPSSDTPESSRSDDGDDASTTATSRPVTRSSSSRGTNASSGKKSGATKRSARGSSGTSED